MNGYRKFKSLRLVRFGDIVYDQQRRLILICRSCQRHYMTMEAFHTHLSKCNGCKHVVSSIDELQYDEDKRETRLINGKQELLIYDPDAVRSQNKRDIDWEAELEDPRWYTDNERSLAVKAKQSPINVKENVVKMRTRHSAMKEVEQQQQQQQQQTSEIPAKRMRHSSPRRTILTNQQQRKSCSSIETPSASMRAKTEVHVPNVVEEVKPAAVSIPCAAPTVTTRQTAPPMVSIPATNVTNGDTQKILNKLRACGVQVKRSNPRENSEIDAASSKRQQALDIMRKLQSNGIKCTKVNNSVKQ